MKIRYVFSGVLALLFAIILTLGTVNQTQATPVTYTYTGSTYTQTTLPGVPGLTLSDRITIFFTMDSLLWGTDNLDLRSDSLGGMNSGPFSAIDPSRVTTDSTGTILAWSFFGSSG